MTNSFAAPPVLPPSQETTAPPEPSLAAAVSTQVDLEVVLNTFVLGDRDRPAQAGVPLGCVFVLSHDHDAFDSDGFPEVYLAGETVRKSDYRKKARCLVAELAEFPGTICSTATRQLAAVSQAETELARFELAVPLRLEDPILFLRRSGGKWMTESDRQALNKRIAADIQGWLEALLESEIRLPDSNLQLWSAEREALAGRIFQRLDDELKRIGLRPDTTFTLLRRYPAALYEIGLQFARAEQILLEAIATGRGAALVEQSGLLPEDLVTIQAASERNEKGPGSALFLVIGNRPAQVREKLVAWLEKQAALAAAACVRELYSGRYSDRDVKLTQQVVLAALRSPMLTTGEWLEAAGGASRDLRPSSFPD